MRIGRARGRVLNFWDMPWGLLHSLEPDDARAIARYLKTALPAVRNRVPEPLRYGVIETIAVKLTRELPAINPGVLTFADGMFGQTAPGIPRELPQLMLVAAQWMVLATGVVAFVLARPASRPARRTRWRRLSRGLGLVAIVLVVAVGWAFYALPFLSVIPPEQIVAAQIGSLPKPSPAAFPSAEQAALAARGRYVYAVTSCALCHGPDGAGGAKVSWKPMGTLWVRNITPDPTTGIGSWSDAQIARAIRSGVSADGRALHWQGMIWDHASNWDEEDIRALVLYLRSLPPIQRQIPAPRPPAADDCDTYTFWTTQSQGPGCGR
jgi:mono/diheme cytochrome c family protein